MKAFLIILLIFILTACKTTTEPAKPKGEWVWINTNLSNDSTTSKLEYSKEFELTKATCSIESSKVQIPSPSCVQPPKQDCTGKTGFALGFCQSYTPKPNCDYSSVNAAQDNKRKVFESCLTLNGWERVWDDYNKEPTKPTAKKIYEIEPELNFTYEKQLVPISVEHRDKAKTYYMLGIANLKGSKATGEPNYSKAEYWLTKAAIRGVTDAKTELAYLYSSTNNIEVFDIQRSIYWAQSAAEEQSCQAVIILGNIYSGIDKSVFNMPLSYAYYDVARFCANERQVEFINKMHGILKPNLKQSDMDKAESLSSDIYKALFVN
ncbi:hypothetical protein [uncultured Psychrosphaera sp.]|uniref:tetratricopeptide repeat protein n=1 Tax=uncultured Psychrosphaera sp. TaxID=1403522 RepID=UPI002635E976|nr:hypothetical protein [uncultured Psychrosphaera sp.]